jgi:hypothetical protein
MDAILNLPWHNPLVQVATLLLALAVIWMVVRFFVHMAFRVLAAGCGLILFIGLLLVVLRLVWRV